MAAVAKHQASIEIVPGLRMKTTPIDKLKPGEWVFQTGPGNGLQVSDDGKHLVIRRRWPFPEGR